MEGKNLTQSCLWITVDAGNEDSVLYAFYYSQQGFALTKPLFFQLTSFSKQTTDLLLCAIYKDLLKKEKEVKIHHANMHGSGTFS